LLVLPSLWSHSAEVAGKPSPWLFLDHDHVGIGEGGIEFLHLSRAAREHSPLIEITLVRDLIVVD
jgi:hypothetical protein